MRVEECNGGNTLIFFLAPLHRHSAARASLFLFFFNTLKICEKFCRRKGALVYGLQYGDEVKSEVAEWRSAERVL